MLKCEPKKKRKEKRTMGWKEFLGQFTLPAAFLHMAHKILTHTKAYQRNVYLLFMYNSGKPVRILNILYILTVHPSPLLFVGNASITKTSTHKLHESQP